MWAKSNPLINETDELKEQIEDFLEKRVAEATKKGSMFRVLVKNFNYWMQAVKNRISTLTTGKRMKLTLILPTQKSTSVLTCHVPTI